MFEPKYSITNKILTSISSIESAKALIENALLVPAWERSFQAEAIVRAVHYSTHIENNPLSYTEVSQILKGKSAEGDFRIRDYREIVNYREVLKFIEENMDENLKMNESLLLTIHKIITSNIVPEKFSGKFRKAPVVLVNSKTRNVSYRAPEYKKVPGLVAGLFDWYNSEKGESTHPVLKAGILHTQMARIHPFVEGNGRTARVMATLSLLLEGYDIRKFFCLDEHYDRDLSRYYEALQSVELNSGDMTVWLEYFSEGLAEELILIKKRVLNLSRDSFLKNKMGQKSLTDRQVKLLEFIQSRGYINNSEWRQVFPQISDDTILRDIKVLLEANLIKKEGKTKSARYLLKV